MSSAAEMRQYNLNCYINPFQSNACGYPAQKVVRNKSQISWDFDVFILVTSDGTCTILGGLFKTLMGFGELSCCNLCSVINLIEGVGVGWRMECNCRLSDQIL